MVTDGSNAYKDFAEMENIRHEQVNATLMPKVRLVWHVLMHYTHS